MDLVVKNLDRPDEAPELPKGHAALVHLDDMTVLRGELEPGWRWSNDWQPIFGGTSCAMPHTGLVLSGTIHFEMDDGTAVDLGPGDVYAIPPGHDAWVTGEEPVRTIDLVPADDAATDAAIEAGTTDR